jgi:hypothetical protein
MNAEGITTARRDKGLQTDFDKKLVSVLQTGLFKLEASFAKNTDVSKRGWLVAMIHCKFKSVD